MNVNYKGVIIAQHTVATIMIRRYHWGNKQNKNMRLELPTKPIHFKGKIIKMSSNQLNQIVV